MEIHIGDRVANIELLEKEGNNVKLCIDDKIFEANIIMAENGRCSLIHNGNSFSIDLICEENEKSYEVNILNRSFNVEIVDNKATYLKTSKHAEERQANRIIAPLPGKIIKVLVHPDDYVKSGDIVLVIEAMKMQSNYKVTEDCKIKEILVKEGDVVEMGQELIILDI